MCVSSVDGRSVKVSDTWQLLPLCGYSCNDDSKEEGGQCELQANMFNDVCEVFNPSASTIVAPLMRKKDRMTQTQSKSSIKLLSL